METVSTKLMGLKSRMTAWKSGWGSPRERRVGSGGALPSAPLSSITATPELLSPSSATWGEKETQPHYGGLAAPPARLFSCLGARAAPGVGTSLTPSPLFGLFWDVLGLTLLSSDPLQSWAYWLAPYQPLLSLLIVINSANS